MQQLGSTHPHRSTSSSVSGLSLLLLLTLGRSDDGDNRSSLLGKDCLDPWQLITGPKRETKTPQHSQTQNIKGSPSGSTCLWTVGGSWSWTQRRTFKLRTERLISESNQKLSCCEGTRQCPILSVLSMQWWSQRLMSTQDGKEVSLSLWVRWIYLHASTRTHSFQFKKSHKYVYLSQDTPISQSTIQQVMPLSCLTVQLK